MTEKVKKFLLGMVALAVLALGGSALAGAAAGGNGTAATKSSQAAEGPEAAEGKEVENSADDSDNVQDGNGEDDSTETVRTDGPVTGDAASRASQAAAARTGGKPGKVERDSDNGATYEVEVTKADGTQADVRLDDHYKVVGIDQDNEQDQAGEQDEAGEQNQAGEQN